MINSGGEDLVPTRRGGLALRASAPLVRRSLAAARWDYERLRLDRYLEDKATNVALSPAGLVALPVTTGHDLEAIALAGWGRNGVEIIETEQMAPPERLSRDYDRQEEIYGYGIAFSPTARFLNCWPRPYISGQYGTKSRRMPFEFDYGWTCWSNDEKLAAWSARDILGIEEFGTGTDQDREIARSELSQPRSEFTDAEFTEFCDVAAFDHSGRFLAVLMRYDGDPAADRLWQETSWLLVDGADSQPGQDYDAEQGESDEAFTEFIVSVFDLSLGSESLDWPSLRSGPHFGSFARIRCERDNVQNLGISLSWSRGGKLLVFEGPEEPAVWIRDPVAKTCEWLGAGGNGGGLAWLGRCHPSAEVCAFADAERLWIAELETGRVIAERNCDKPIREVAWSLDGKALFALSTGNVLWRCDLSDVFGRP